MICFHWRWMRCFYARLLGRLQQSCCTQKDVVRKANKHRWALLSIGSLLPSDLHPEESHKAAADWERVNKTVRVSEDTYSLSLSLTYTCTNHSCCLGHNRIKDSSCISFIMVYIYIIHVMQQTQTNLEKVKICACMSILSVSSRRMTALTAVKTWLGCCLSCSCPLNITLGETAVWSPPALPSSCFQSFHLVSFFFFTLLSPMSSFGMTQLDVFKLKWKKGIRDLVCPPLQDRGSYHWSEGWVSLTQMIPRFPRQTGPFVVSVA